mmetsp:Transcript_64267/g.139854  ORF Transcript_64267/g.139854 Transcript_64267/m.139854 type:complete len:226 (+) Transcript_64267:555-1232(+)
MDSRECGLGRHLEHGALQRLMQLLVVQPKLLAQALRDRRPWALRCEPREQIYRGRRPGPAVRPSRPICPEVFRLWLRSVLRRFWQRREATPTAVWRCPCPRCSGVRPHRLGHSCCLAGPPADIHRQPLAGWLPEPSLQRALTFRPSERGSLPQPRSLLCLRLRLRLRPNRCLRSAGRRCQTPPRSSQSREQSWSFCHGHSELRRPRRRRRRPQMLSKSRRRAWPS